MNQQPNDIIETILKKLRALNWAGRLLTTVALGVGLLAIAGGILLTMPARGSYFPRCNCC
ncbi:MAG TPA: hypothetical protein VGY56_15010 [Verrucomicrobiae bacterium]|nr:hypothetical protein [Verrucomicrobiae bacterium]